MVYPSVKSVGFESCPPHGLGCSDLPAPPTGNNRLEVVRYRQRLAAGVLSLLLGERNAFSLALEKYGTMPLNKVVRPAMKLAEEGFVVNDALADDLKTYGSEVLPNHENSKAIFWKDGEPLKKGDKLVQKNLAKSLEMIAESGP
ncbi:MAG: gamma-glutamyltransferase, partial [Clostridiaceae bacterium]|nr:gamma-glutamyltransferase [Clostridiaceae bacterium]